MNDLRTRKIKEDELPLRLRIKKYRMLFFYYTKRIRSKFSVAYLIFMLNIALFCLILIPNLAHRLPIPIGNWPLMFELRGTVLIETTNDLNESTLVPVSMLQVEIGGYYAMTDSDGKFGISFPTQSHTIPIVFLCTNGTVVKWTYFQQGEFYKEEVFVLE